MKRKTQNCIDLLSEGPPTNAQDLITPDLVVETSLILIVKEILGIKKAKSIGLVTLG